MRNSTQKGMGSAKDPEKPGDCEETNGRRIEAKTGAYEANTKKPRHSILRYKNGVSEPILDRRSNITIRPEAVTATAESPFWENRKPAELGKLLRYTVCKLTWSLLVVAVILAGIIGKFAEILDRLTRVFFLSPAQEGTDITTPRQKGNSMTQFIENPFENEQNTESSRSGPSE
jgi:hypothetical protein